VVQGVRVIKGFAGEPQFRTRFERANRHLRDQGNQIFHQAALFSSLVTFLSSLSLVFLIGYGGFLVMKGELPLGTGLVVFCGLLQQFSENVSNLAQLANQIQDCLAGARRVFEVLEAPLEIADMRNPKPLQRGKACAVEFDHVSFEYTSGKPVLCDVSFRVEPGQCIAIVGTTGSGKSTLLSLIPRFYDPVSGSIRINGTDIRELKLEDLRHNVGVVFQESFLFRHRILDNIAFGEIDADRKRIVNAAKIAAAHEFIMEMPNGYETLLGERGGGISGGQSQRIAIARAILPEPSILLLDDPTAAIDPGTEHEILQAMENAMSGRTTFIVAHRMSTLKRADLILVLDHGRLVQCGRHEELATLQGPYQEIVRSQSMDSASRQALASAEPGESFT
jgi:ATP-binding cassette subfamily B protein